VDLVPGHLVYLPMLSNARLSFTDKSQRSVEDAVAGDHMGVGRTRVHDPVNAAIGLFPGGAVAEFQPPVPPSPTSATQSEPVCTAWHQFLSSVDTGDKSPKSAGFMFNPTQRGGFSAVIAQQPRHWSGAKRLLSHASGHGERQRNTRAAIRGE
jgi:hypothetical protein